MTLATAALACAIAGAQTQTDTIEVFVVSYFPTDGANIDKAITVDVGVPLTEIRAKTQRLTNECAAALGKGSRFRGYKLDSPPALEFEIVGQVEYLEPLPMLKPVGENPPLPDYAAVMERINARELVEQKGVQEIWIWGYHGKIGLWESNMSSPHGDVSNSDRNPNDLPVFDSTYTVYHYNYGRGLGEMLENHMHQLEALLNHADGRETTPPEDWDELLFWGRFVGSDASHKIVTTPAHCGWTHYAPNSVTDYDWDNLRYVMTDIEDWRPDWSGEAQPMNAKRWDLDPIKWRIYWMQAIPGVGHELSWKGEPLRNWWHFVSRWDEAKEEGWTLEVR